MSLPSPVFCLFDRCCSGAERRICCSAAFTVCASMMESVLCSVLHSHMEQCQRWHIQALILRKHGAHALGQHAGQHGRSRDSQCISLRTRLGTDDTATTCGKVPATIGLRLSARTNSKAPLSSHLCNTHASKCISFVAAARIVNSTFEAPAEPHTYFHIRCYQPCDPDREQQLRLSRKHG